MLNSRAASGKKKDLPIKQIRQMLDNGIRQIDVAILFEVSQSTISRYSDMPSKMSKQLNKNAQLCSSCHKRVVAKGNRFLCTTCFGS